MRMQPFPASAGMQSNRHATPFTSPTPHCTPRPPQEVAAYEATLARLEAEGLRPLEERTFQARLAEAEAEAQRER